MDAVGHAAQCNTIQKFRKARLVRVIHRITGVLMTWTWTHSDSSKKGKKCATSTTCGGSASPIDQPIENKFGRLEATCWGLHLFVR